MWHGEKIAEAREQLKAEDQRKVAFVKRAHNDFISEYSKMDDELNLVGHPKECRRDWLAEAVESEILEESEFNRLFELVDIVSMEDAMAMA